MKRFFLIVIFCVGLIPFSIAFGQRLSLPEWIEGTWHNSYESNTEHFVFWTFSHDSIFIDKGLPLKKSDRKCLNTDYSGYKIAEHSNDSLYRVDFSKGLETIVYEFKLKEVDYSDKPVLTFSLTVNGALKKNDNQFLSMNHIRIVRYQPGQEEMIFHLIKRVYDEFVAIDYSEEGNRFFYDWIQPSRIAHRQLNRNNIWEAFKDAELVGMIEIRDNKFISLLFVDKAYHGQGIAKRLVNEALKEVLQRDPTLDKLYVHASPYSIPVYRKLGFIETDKMLEENGIRYLPMEMRIRL